MKKFKKMILFVIIPAAVIFIICIACTTIYIATYIFPAFAPRWITQLPPNPPLPAIKYGEFPFKLEYELNGEIKTVEDVIICEFSGFFVSGGADGEKHRQWKSYLASGNTRIILTVVDGVEIFFSPIMNNEATAAVYMGDNEKHSEINQTFPNAWFTSDFENERVNPYIIFAEDMWNKYNLKLLKWEQSAPIENYFWQSDWYYVLVGTVIAATAGTILFRGNS